MKLLFIHSNSFTERENNLFNPENCIYGNTEYISLAWPTISVVLSVGLQFKQKNTILVVNGTNIPSPTIAT